MRSSRNMLSRVAASQRTGRRGPGPLDQFVHESIGAGFIEVVNLIAQRLSLAGGSIYRNLIRAGERA
jgi:hypothetical protein